MGRVMCIINVQTHPVYRTGCWTFVPSVGSIYTVISFCKANSVVHRPDCISAFTIWDSYLLKEGDGSFPVDCFATMEEETEQIEIEQKVEILTT